MLIPKRDTLLGSAHLAVPSMGEIEGKMMVLELVALASLTRLMDGKRKQAADDLGQTIRRAVRIKCHNAKLGEEDVQSAQDYADELIKAACETIGKATRKHAV